MSHKPRNQPTVSLSTEKKDGILTLGFTGHLDSYTAGHVWREAVQTVEKNAPDKVIVDASELEYCDGSGVALFVKLRDTQEAVGGEFEVRNLAEQYRKLMDLFPSEKSTEEETAKTPEASLPEELGRATVSVWQEVYSSIAFLGEAVVAVLSVLPNPGKIRWKDVLLTSEKIGVNAFTIIALVNFLVGLVIAFQSAIPLKQYGGEIFVADLIVLSTFRELGPLMTAIVVNGRSGSAFAAELGTMKVNEEIDALSTMGLEPVRFLVVSKMLAAIFMIPILTVFGNFFGLLGGGVVMLALGFPPVAYINEMVIAASYVDLLGGLFKSLFFAAIIAGVGCLEGLRTKTGAAAVGDSTTRAVVSGLVLIIVVDGIFGVVFYYLGI